MWEVSHISVSNLEFEILEFVWDLGFGIWDFEFPASDRRFRRFPA